MARAWPLPELVAARKTGPQITVAIATRVAELWSWAPHLTDPRRVDELHAMRISAKRLRYLLEDLRPLLGDRARKPIRRLRRLQEALGAVHDCDVQVDTLREALGVHDARRRRLAARVADCRGASDPGLADAAARLAASFDELPTAGLAALLSDVVERRRRLHAELLERFARLEARGLRRRLTELGS